MKEPSVKFFSSNVLNIMTKDVLILLAMLVSIDSERNQWDSLIYMYMWDIEKYLIQWDSLAALYYYADLCNTVDWEHNRYKTMSIIDFVNFKRHNVHVPKWQ